MEAKYWRLRNKVSSDILIRIKGEELIQILKGVHEPLDFTSISYQVDGFVEPIEPTYKEISELEFMTVYHECFNKLNLML